MQASPAVRAAGKKMQLERLKHKGEKDYGEYYANQPKELLRAKKNADLRDARQASVAAQEALQIAEITGEGLSAAQETAQIAALVVQNHEDAMNVRPLVALTGTGSK